MIGNWLDKYNNTNKAKTVIRWIEVNKYSFVGFCLTKMCLVVEVDRNQITQEPNQEQGSVPFLKPNNLTRKSHKPTNKQETNQES